MSTLELIWQHGTPYAIARSDDGVLTDDGLDVGSRTEIHVAGSHAVARRLTVAELIALDPDATLGHDRPRRVRPPRSGASHRRRRARASAADEGRHELVRVLGCDARRRPAGRARRDRRRRASCRRRARRALPAARRPDRARQAARGRREARRPVAARPLAGARRRSARARRARPGPAGRPDVRDARTPPLALGRPRPARDPRDALAARPAPRRAPRPRRARRRAVAPRRRRPDAEPAGLAAARRATTVSPSCATATRSAISTSSSPNWRPSSRASSSTTEGEAMLDTDATANSCAS